MQIPPLPGNEAERLQALQACEILDTPPEAQFDRLTRLAQKLFKVPVSLITVVDARRQWFKSCQGLDGISETSRDISFCGHAILDTKTLNIPDTLLDERFADNPLVSGPPHIRFYAGAPIKTPEGFHIGTLCIVDYIPRQLDADELAALRDLADCVEDELKNYGQQHHQDALLALARITTLPATDTETALRAALKLGCQYLELPFGIISHIQNDDYEVQIQVSPPDTLKDGDHFSLGNTYCSITLQANDVMPIAHMGKSKYAGHPCYQNFGLESYIGVPLHIAGKPYGTLNFSSPEPRSPRRFTEAEVEFVRLLGSWVANTLQRGQLDASLTRHQQRLQDSESRYRSLFELSEDANMTLNAEGFVDCNQATLAMFGCSDKAEFLGKHPSEISPSHQVDGRSSLIAADEQIRKAYEQGRNLFEWTHQRQNGETFPAEVLLTPMRLDGRDLLQAIVRDITERKQAEQALQHERDRAQSYLDTVQAVMVSLDNSGHILMINRKGCELLGYEEGELLGRNWFEKCLPAPDGVQTVYPVFLKIMAGELEATEYFENPVRCRDGRERLIAWHNAFLLDDKGKIYASLSSGEDITERKQSEEILRKQATIIDQIHDSGVATDIGGLVTSWNKGAERLFGYTRDEMLGRHITIIYPEKERARLEPDIFTPLMDKGEHETEVRMQRKSGEEFFARQSLSVLSDDAGQPIGMIGYSMDISERKLAEQARNESESRLNFLLSSSPVVIYTCDARPPFGATYISPNVVRLMGFQPEQFTTESGFWLNNIHPDDQQRVLNDLPQLFEHGRHHHEYRFRMPDGLYQWVHDELRLIHDDRGEPLEMIGTWQDISERKRIEKMKNEFISTVSHELRTPLTSIIGSLGLVKSDVLGELPEQIQEMIRIAHKNGQRLSHLINDLLDMEKLVAGKMVLHMAPQALLPLVRQAIADNETYANQHQVQFALSSQSIDVNVKVDEQRLHQVLTNLLSNAAKFSPDSSVVKISIHHRNDTARVEVADRGPGIPSAFREHIFEKFAQADASDTRHAGGTGLGLSISRELMERMGGCIGFESVEGEGATFYFELPVASET